MSVCQVRQLKIGEGKPKVCIPVVETTTSSILKEIQFLQSYLFDIIELRIDFYQDIHVYRIVCHIISLSLQLLR